MRQPSLGKANVFKVFQKSLTRELAAEDPFKATGLSCEAWVAAVHPAIRCHHQRPQPTAMVQMKVPAERPEVPGIFDQE